VVVVPPAVVPTTVTPVPAASTPRRGFDGHGPAAENRGHSGRLQKSAPLHFRFPR
jgi:hypothetical protein